MARSRHTRGYDADMKTILWLGLFASSGYLLVWGFTWLAGDKSTATMLLVRGGPDGGSASTNYPGVFMGGLPPIPNFDTDLPQLVAVLVGIVGLGLLAGLPIVRAAKRH
jgi:hypothetical protein